MRFGRRASTLLTDSSLAKPVGEGTETREERRQAARTREERRGSTILTGASLAKPVGEGTETREEGRQNKPDPCQVIVDARKREFVELLRIRRAIGPATAAKKAKEQEIQQLEKLRPGDKMPGGETPAKKKPAVPPLPIPSLPGKGKRPLPPTGILGLFLELQRKSKEFDEFNQKRGISAEKLKAELKELEK